MRVSEIRVNQIRVNQGLGVHIIFSFQQIRYYLLMKQNNQFDNGWVTSKFFIQS